MPAVLFFISYGLRPIETNFKMFYTVYMKYKIHYEREKDGRWIAEIEELPGVLAYGKTKKEAIIKTEALALRVIAERIEHGESGPDFTISFTAPATL